MSGRSQAQCGGRPFSFVVHGLWPQYEHGFPDYCQRPSPRLDRNIMTSMLDLMPAPGLIFNEWDKHGTCSGLPRAGLFRNHPQGARGGEDPAGISRIVGAEDGRARRDRGRLRQGQSGPEAMRRIAVTCNRTRLSEVRICMSKDLQFRDCEEIDRRACRRDEVVMPPMRGG